MIVRVGRALAAVSETCELQDIAISRSHDVIVRVVAERARDGNVTEIYSRSGDKITEIRRTNSNTTDTESWVYTYYTSGANLEQAIGRAYSAAAMIHFDGMHYRRDIGAKGLKRYNKNAGTGT